VVKNAVAPAMRKGSFFSNSFNDSRSNPKKLKKGVLALPVMKDKDKC
jgi:hypothetical protein